MNNNREQRLAIEAMADLFCATVEWGRTNGGHLKITFRARGRSMFLIVGSNKSDWRAIHNNVSRARRILRELTAKAA